MKKSFILLLVIVLTSGTTFSQSSKMRLADTYFNKLSYSLAVPIYLDMIGSKEESLIVKQKLAVSYYNLGDMPNAEKYFTEIISSDIATAEDYFLYAQALKQNGKIVESDERISQLNQKFNSDLRGISYAKNTNYKQKIENESYHFEIKDLAINTRFTEFGGYQIRGTNDVVIISNLKQSSSVKKQWAWNSTTFLDFFIAHQEKKDSLSAPLFAKGKSNSKFHEGSLCFSLDGKKVYFTRNNISEGKSRRDNKGIQNLKIYEAEVSQNGDWINEKEISFNSKDYSVGHPSISSDGKTLYFASDMPGGFGGADIYFVSILQDGTYGKPTNLGSEINTEGNEMFPWIDSDGKLYFASNGHVGLGGLDIFIAFPTKTETFKKVTNLGNKINSNNDDFALVFNEDNKTGYFSSNRITGKGDDDLYAFTKVSDFKNAVILEGVITDLNSKQILPNSKVLIKDETGKVVNEIITDSKGKYSIELEENKKYLVQVNQDTYFEGNKSIETASVDPKTGILNGDISLEKRADVMLICLITDGSTKKPLEGVNVKITEKTIANPLLASNTDATGSLKKEVVGKKSGDNVNYTISLAKEGYLSKTVDYSNKVPVNGLINLNENMDLTLTKIEVGTDLASIIDIKPIYFDLGKADIRKDATIELDKIVKVMNDNPGMIVELGSHTDCRSTIKFNKDLSSRRAETSANYIKKRISKPERIYGKGYGESKLKVDCPCEGNVKSNCPEEEHQKNRRTEFVIIKM